MGAIYKRTGGDVTKDGKKMFHCHIVRELKAKDKEIARLKACQALTEANFTDYAEEKNHDIKELKAAQALKVGRLENLLTMCCRDLYSQTGTFKKATALKLYKYVNENGINV